MTVALKPEFHWDRFKDFCKLEKELNGPDPQLETIYRMCLLDQVPTYEMAWRAGLAVGVWNVPTAEMIWREWPLERALYHPEEIEPWLAEHWPGIFYRRERRCVNTPPKMARYIEQLAQWVPKVPSLALDYEVFWNSVQDDVLYMGRYIALKYLEFLGRYCGVPISCPDIRAEGGWSPVRTLGMMYTTLNDQIAAADKQEAIRLAEEYAAISRQRLGVAGIDVSFFELQVMLCEYRTSYEHRHQYPGRSLDEELEFATKVQSQWPQFADSTIMYKARLEAFPSVALGEFNNWNKIRKELGVCIRDYDYHWSDLRYEYAKTTDLANPSWRVRRGA